MEESFIYLHKDGGGLDWLSACTAGAGQRLEVEGVLGSYTKMSSLSCVARQEQLYSWQVHKLLLRLAA